MKAIPRIGGAALLGVLCLTLVGLPLLWAARPGAFADLFRLLVREPARTGAMDARYALLRKIREDKGQVVAELVAERLTLAEAAERFERLEEQLAETADEGVIPTRRLEGRAELCRCVLEWARDALRDRADGPARLAQLRGELSRLEVAEAPAVEAAETGPVGTM